MTDPIKGGGSKPPIKQTETSSTSESTSKDAKVQKDSTPQETQDPKKLAKAKSELASTKKFDMQLGSISQKLASELPKTPGKVLDQKTNVAEPACTGTLLTTCGVPDTKELCKGTDLSSLPGRTPGNVLDQKTNVAEPACTGTLLSTCNVPDTKELCDTLSKCQGTDLSSLPGRTPGNILDQKTNVAEPACTGTLLSTCNVPDTKELCDTLSKCQGTDLSSLPGRTPGNILDQKTNVAEPACTGTLLSTCNVPDTKELCDTLSKCQGTDLSSLPRRGPGNILDQKTNVAEPACSGSLFSTCGVPDTKPNVCDTLSGCK
jgi:hypothetical protein